MWQELADGVFRRRYQALDLNVGLVVGTSGLLLVDTRASHRQARELVNHLKQISSLPVRWVVNTHWHWDHCWGNALFDGELWGHLRTRERLLGRGDEARAGAFDWLGEEAREEIEEVEITPPDHIFDLSTEIDLGNRLVTLSYLGLAHTDADIVVEVSDADVVFAGDIVEEPGPPYFGDGYPLDWPATLEGLEPLIQEVVVPGHGDIVDAEFVANQRDELGAVAAMAERAWRDGRPLDDVTEGPYPLETMSDIFGRAYMQLEARA